MRTLFLTFGCLGALMMACSDGGGTGSSQDVVSGDVGSEIPEDGGASFDIGAPLEDVGSTEPEPGGPFSPCSSLLDCASGFCVESPDGLVCSSGCDPECPENWQCREVQSGSGDPVFICVNPLARLCHPCAEDADCRAAGVSEASACIDSGNGNFCGVSCGVDGGISCPDGFACDTSQPVPQCIPETGECTCNGLAKSLELETACQVTNDVGTCQGRRVCLFDGLTQCDAVPASVEVCNGVDDNCDGVIDNDWEPKPCTVDNEFGSCPGEEYCTSGESQCLGAAPKAEACNGVDDDCDGLTDEDFGDVDGDQTVDCLDDDIDGDGTPNELDCDPYDPDVNPAATEVCDGKDTNCDKIVDNENAAGCTDYFLDIDQDSFGNPNSSARCLCGPDVTTFFTASNTDDCDDQKPLVYPGAPELCNTLDDDCDNEKDEVEDLAPCTVDNENGSCVGVTSCTGGLLVCNGPTPQPEVCNGVDDNCDGAVDEGFPNADQDAFADCVDDDKDGDGDLNEVDCAPLDPAINSAALEICGNAVDENCNNLIDDEGGEGCTTFYQDADLDTWGSDTAPSKCLCSAKQAIYYTATSQGDCNDLNSFANPNQVETCNGQDDDCDGQTDEGVLSPCGNCESLCVLEIGEGQEFPWDPAANDASNVSVVAGDLVLDTATGLSGSYRQVFDGWIPSQAPNKSDWGLFIVKGDFPPGTSLLVKARVADSQAQLSSVEYTLYGSFPPSDFPIDLNMNGHVLDVELGLSSTDSSIVPSMDEVTVVVEKAP